MFLDGLDVESTRSGAGRWSATGVSPVARRRLAQAAAVGVLTAVWSILFALTGAAIFSLSLVVLLTALLFFGNRLKLAQVREPLLLNEFSYLGQMLRHPVLYFGFLRPEAVGAIVVAIVLFVAVPVTAELLLRDWLPRPGWPARLGAGLAGIGAFVALLLWARRHGEATGRWLGFTFVPHEDGARFGFLAILLFYGLAWLDARDLARRRAQLAVSRTPAPMRVTGHAPHIVLVQAESFFDPARVLPQESARLGVALEAFSRLRGVAYAHGTLAVPTFGGNSMRTEFAVLSGAGADRAGVHAVDPYARLARSGIDTVAHRLRAAGYRTVLVHPFDGRFFRRNKVYDKLGFDVFLDGDALAGLPCCGPYASDAALAAVVLDLLKKDGATQPLFVFVITMECHGPWPEERASALVHGGAATASLAPMAPAVAGMLLHLRNTDRMIGDLMAGLRAESRGGVLGVYGDHLPPGAPFVGLGDTHRLRTDYAIAATAASRPARGRVPLRAEQLGDCLLQAAGLAAPPQSSGH